MSEGKHSVYCNACMTKVKFVCEHCDEEFIEANLKIPKRLETAESIIAGLVEKSRIAVRALELSEYRADNVIGAALQVKVTAAADFLAKEWEDE